MKKYLLALPLFGILLFACGKVEREDDVADFNYTVLESDVDTAKIMAIESDGVPENYYVDEETYEANKPDSFEFTNSDGEIFSLESYYPEYCPMYYGWAMDDKSYPFTGFVLETTNGNIEMSSGQMAFIYVEGDKITAAIFYADDADKLSTCNWMYVRGGFDTTKDELDKLANISWDSGVKMIDDEAFNTLWDFYKVIRSSYHAGEYFMDSGQGMAMVSSSGRVFTRDSGELATEYDHRY